MEKEIKKIVAYIKKNYNRLKKSNIDNKELVIFATGDFSGEYGYGSSDLEGWGVDIDGKLYWVYASGCSCNCSAGSDKKTIKMFIAEPQEGCTDIMKAIGLFNTNKKKFDESLSELSYESY